MCGMPLATHMSMARSSEFEIAVRTRQQDRHALGAVDGIEVQFIEAEHVVGAGSRTAAQLFDVAGIDADLEAFALQRRNGFLKMRKLHIRLAADVDHVAALGDQLAAARHQLLDREARRIDDLGEDANVLLRQIRRLAVVAEELRQVDDLIRTALERHAVMLLEVAEVHAAAPRHDDPIGFERLLQAVAHDVLGHQRGDLDAEVGDAPRPVRQPHGRHRLGKPRLGEAPGQEQ